jgi:hypothetical protein
LCRIARQQAKVLMCASFCLAKSCVCVCDCDGLVGGDDREGTHKVTAPSMIASHHASPTVLNTHASDAVGLVLNAPSARRRQHDSRCRGVQTRDWSWKRSMCQTLRRVSGEAMVLPVDMPLSRPCSLPCDTPCFLAPHTPPGRRAKAKKPKAKYKDGSKTGLKVARCRCHTPTHSLCARSSSQALVGLLHQVAPPRLRFFPHRLPLPSLSELSQGLLLPAPILPRRVHCFALLLLLFLCFCSCVKSCHH